MNGACEMINFMQAYAAKNLKGKATLTVNNSGTDAQKQIAVISDMISDKVDAIMINPASDTALNSVIEEACKQGIVVVSFDQGVTAPCAYNIGVDYVKLGEIHAQWMADTLGGKGSVVINRGVSGFPADKNLYQGTRNILDKYPDIKIAAEVYGKWDNAVSQRRADQGVDCAAEGRWRPESVRDLWRVAGVHQPQSPFHTDVRSGRKRMAHRHAGGPGKGLKRRLGG